MSTVSNPRITLELEAGADPIRGTIEHADGSHRAFWGWLELSAELRRITADQPDPSLQPPEANPGRSAATDPQARRQNPRTTTEEQP